MSKSLVSHTPRCRCHNRHVCPLTLQAAQQPQPPASPVPVAAVDRPTIMVDSISAREQYAMMSQAERAAYDALVALGLTPRYMVTGQIVTNDRGLLSNELLGALREAGVLARISEHGFVRNVERSVTLRVVDGPGGMERPVLTDASPSEPRESSSRSGKSSSSKPGAPSVKIGNYKIRLEKLRQYVEEFESGVHEAKWAPAMKGWWRNHEAECRALLAEAK